MKLTIPEASHRGTCRQAGFASFILAEGAKTEILYFASPGTAGNGSSDLSKGEVNRKPQGRAVGKLFRLISG